MLQLYCYRVRMDSKTNDNEFVVAESYEKAMKYVYEFCTEVHESELMGCADIAVKDLPNAMDLYCYRVMVPIGPNSSGVTESPLYIVAESLHEAVAGREVMSTEYMGKALVAE